MELEVLTNTCNIIIIIVLVNTGVNTGELQINTIELL